MFIAYEAVEKTAEHFSISLEDTKTYIKQACQILFKERSKRPRPHLDDKMVTAWNGNAFLCHLRSCCYDDVITPAIALCSFVTYVSQNLMWLSPDLFAGLMISGFARAGAAVRNAKYVELATDAAKFVERYLFDKNKGVLLRSCYRGEGDKIIQT